jgi:hypothetical protein
MFSALSVVPTQRSAFSRYPLNHVVLEIAKIRGLTSAAFEVSQKKVRKKKASSNAPAPKPFSANPKRPSFSIVLLSYLFKPHFLHLNKQNTMPSCHIFAQSISMCPLRKPPRLSSSKT